MYVYMAILILSYLTETRKKEEITPLKLENIPICLPFLVLQHFRFFLCISIWLLALCSSQR